MRAKHKVLHDKTKVRRLVKGFKRIKKIRNCRSQMFFKIDMFLKTSQYWSQFLIKMQAFFNRTPMVAASRFSRQQILFFQLNLVVSADSRTGFCSGPL